MIYTGVGRKMTEIVVNAEWPRNGEVRMAFVGEAPSTNEERQGSPFVGPAGKLFNSLLRTAGIDRDDVYVGNVFDVKLPDNDVKNWCMPTKEFKALKKSLVLNSLIPTAANTITTLGLDLPPVIKGWYLRSKYVHHLDRLAEEMAEIKPNVIIPLGGTALWAFTGYVSPMSKRGAVDEASMTAPSVKIVPTLHPAFLLHAPKFFTTIAADFIKAKGESTDRALYTTPREIWLEPTLEDLWRFKEKYLDNAPYISIDIETIPKFRQITCIGFSSGPHKAIVVPFTDERVLANCYWPTLAEELEAWKFVEAVCGSTIPKLGQNFPYDFSWLWHLYGIKVNNYVEDTRLLSHALFPELPKSLEFLGATFARERAWKTFVPKTVDGKVD